MVIVGVAAIVVTIAVLVGEFLRHRRRPLPAYAWAALAALIAAWLLTIRGLYPVNVYFTPIAWTCHIILLDGAVSAITGRSRLRGNPREFVLVALLSIPLWLIFEAYNRRLANWTYVGVPEEPGLALLGYGWSFATITPGILQTADLVHAFGWFGPAPPLRFSPPAQLAMMTFGAAALTLPLVLPVRVAAYLFALVWVGFVFVLDPVNHRLGLPSLLGDFAAGRRSRFWSLFLSGWICGWLWEFWNYWAAAKWHYTFPMFQQWKIFEMPAPGYLGFPPFALEGFAMCVSARWLLEKAGVRVVRKPNPPFHLERTP